MALNYLRENRYERPVLILAPSASPGAQRDPQSPSRLYGPCQPWDDAEDGVYGPTGDIRVVRTSRGKWDSF